MRMKLAEVRELLKDERLAESILEDSGDSTLNGLYKDLKVALGADVARKDEDEVSPQTELAAQALITYMERAVLAKYFDHQIRSF